MKSELKSLRDKIRYYFRYHLIDKKIVNVSKIYFHNWWNADTEEQWFYQFILNRKIPLNNAIHFFSVFGKKNFLKYYPVDGNKVFYTGEDVYNNAFGSYKQYMDYCLDDVDLSLGFDERGSQNYLRFPVWIFYLVNPTWDYQTLKDYIDNVNKPEFRMNTNRTGFVSHISRHDSNGIRRYLIDLLSKIDEVECAGSFLNNTDRLIINYNDDKIEYLKNFKFNLCPENTSINHYITEKCIESICAGCIPIYWGGGKFD
ncbi:TPA: glycosyltransferase family 10 [Pasteurella multocida]